MTTFGVVPEGFRRKTLDEIKTDLENDELANIGSDFGIAPEDVAGQFNGIVARQLGIAWENLEAAYEGFDPDAAEGRLLEMLAKLTGTFRNGDTPSEVVLTCDLDIGTELIPNEHYAAIEDHTDIRWTPSPTLYPSNYVAVVGGAQPVTFISELLGPIDGFAGTINVIATPLVGWNSVVNPVDAELGLNVDTDPGFRLRRERELAAIGSSTVRGIAAKVSKAFFAQLQTLTVYENDTDTTDVNGVPPHSVEVLIFDGDVPTIVDNALAQVIFDSKAGGIQSYGTTTAQAIALVNGVEVSKPVKFTRAEQLLVYLEIDITKKTLYVGDVKAAESIAISANARFGPGNTVVASILEGFAADLAGVFDVTAVRLGLAPSPVGTVNIPVNIRQTARFSTSRILITSVNAVVP